MFFKFCDQGEGLANMDIVHLMSFSVKKSMPEVIKLFMLNSAEYDVFSANMKMPTKAGIFIFISREIFMLSCV